MTPLRLSNSEMTDYRRCKRRWWLGTYRRLGKKAPLEPMSALRIGNVVHDALAAYYADTSVDPVEFAQDVIDAEREENPTETKAFGQEASLVTAMLEGYLEWLEETGADADLVIEGTESKVEVPLVEGITILSKLDAPVSRHSDGAKLALEHKTVGSLDQLLPLLRLDTQFLTEHLVRFLDARMKGATDAEAYDQCHGVLVNMLRKVKRTAAAKPPFYDRIDVPHNIHELRNHWRHVLAVAIQIQETRARLDAGEDHHKVVPPSPDKTCSWQCAFYPVCPMADDGSDFEGALEGMYEERDPLERYLEAESL